MMKKNVAKRVARMGLMVALAFIFSYIEMLFPFSFGIPGIKLGLANLVVLSCLFYMPVREVLPVLIARIVLSGILFGNPVTIIYSLAGGLLSFWLMYLLKQVGRLSMMGVSIVGGIGHNIGQILVAVWLVSNTSILYYLPILLVSGAISGALIGIAAKKCSPALRFVL